MIGHIRGQGAAVRSQCVGGGHVDEPGAVKETILGTASGPTLKKEVTMALSQNKMVSVV